MVEHLENRPNWLLEFWEIANKKELWRFVTSHDVTIEYGRPEWCSYSVFVIPKLEVNDVYHQT